MILNGGAHTEIAEKKNDLSKEIFKITDIELKDFYYVYRRFNQPYQVISNGKITLKIENGKTSLIGSPKFQ